MKFKAWCQAKGTTEENAFPKEYVTAKRVAKRAVAQAQQTERKSLGNKINSVEVQSSVFRNLLIVVIC